MFSQPKPHDLALPWQNPKVIAYSVLLVESYEHWLKTPLLLDCKSTEPAEIAEALFEAPFPILAHGPQPDPLLNYANRCALNLWRFEWDTMEGWPSRNVADPATLVQEDRDMVIERCKRDGFVKGYSGRRMSARGERFEIMDAVTWNIIDKGGARFGQALRVNNWWYF